MLCHPHTCMLSYIQMYVHTHMEGHHRQYNTCKLSWHNKCGGTSCVCTITWLHCPRVPHGDHHLISDQAIHCSVPRADHVPLVDALVHFVHSYIYCTCCLHMLLSWPTHCIIQYRMFLRYTSDAFWKCYLHLYFVCVVSSLSTNHHFST